MLFLGKGAPPTRARNNVMKAHSLYFSFEFANLLM